MLNSPSELIVPKGTAIVGMLKSDPRPGVQILNDIYTPVPIPNFQKRNIQTRRVPGLISLWIWLCEVNPFLFFFSLKDGDMTALVPKLNLKGQFHFGRDNVFTAHTSNAVVSKGSALKVIFKHMFDILIT